jgi:hypothetical protein
MAERSSQANSYKVACPRCGAKPLALCWRLAKSGRKGRGEETTDRVHNERAKAARQVEAA